MKFRTEIEIKERYPGAISHDDLIWTIGSCFADEIGDKMLAEGFNVEVNPLGTLYNPLSIRHSVQTVTGLLHYAPSQFFEHEGKFRNYDFHSAFARRTAEDSAAFVNETLDRLRSQLPHLTTLMLTFGSSRCFRLRDTHQPVANCHKQHPSNFIEEDISLAQCRSAIYSTISQLCSVAPKLRTVILTVSPIRHKAYGLHADRLSKSRLLLAIDELLSQLSLVHPDLNVVYFPSYEIMMDDLRDYRFYAADMVHPSPTAVDYIYEHFSSTFYSLETLAEGARNLRNFRRSLHR